MPRAKKKDVEQGQVVEAKAACTNCDDSGRACSVCHAGDLVE